ncbi:acetylornithine deacetylase [Marimonas arenosa]|uniref:Acetylornithine deacetylase n=1 Tax=Marimonas arenosa TaxID=1795305 RepID=A0AAE4B5Z9_9RHOB|nr:acetylornithine deacetylase [Marimonas arenosa]MDQ2091865.1 acetylornithine deacetylase [Marimonas arenosa]
MSRVLAHLERLVGFRSLTDRPNGDIVDYLADALGAAGARVHRLFDESGERSGIFASLGPKGPGGVMLSGHVDVVPVVGQAWSSDPFRLRHEGDRVYGRGTTDMKGYLACMLVAAERAGDLARPLKLAFSWDEEIGCRGIPVMLARLEETVGRPEICIVGEPTQMRIAIGHKGKTSLRAVCHGAAGHSADAPDYVNALHLAAAFINALQAEQARLQREGTRDAGFSTPVSTVHAGVMQGGTALNIVPDRAEILFEIRNLAPDVPEEIIARLRAAAARIGGIEIEETGGYPGLAADTDGPAVRLMQQIMPEAALTKVSYGTEAGHFARAGIDTVVCGPGTMAQGHKPDEFIEIAELKRCEAMLERLLARLRCT